MCLITHNCSYDTISLLVIKDTIWVLLFLIIAFFSQLDLLFPKLYFKLTFTHYQLFLHNLPIALYVLFCNKFKNWKKFFFPICPSTVMLSVNFTQDPKFNLSLCSLQTCMLLLQSLETKTNKNLFFRVMKAESFLIAIISNKCGKKQSINSQEDKSL